MKQRTLEWISKAEGDWIMSQRQRQAADPIWDGICFHAQQCAEKYIKAFLEEQTIAFQKTHDLVGLVDLSSGLLAALNPLRFRLAQLSTFGITTRYPGVQADQLAADEALKTAEETRAVIRTKFGLP